MPVSPCITANLGLASLATSADSLGQVLKDTDGGVPVDAGISDADTALQGGGAFSGDLLVAGTDVGLDHNTDDSFLALAELVSNHFGDLGLVVVVLLGVAWSIVRGIYKKQSLMQTYRESSQP